MKHARILVAEDEPFIALDLAMAIEDAGGEVVGPATRVREALTLLEETAVVGAILDVNLVDGDISPVVKKLMALGIPIIVQTGVGLPPELSQLFPNLSVRIKPCIAAELVRQLVTLIDGRAS